MHVHRKFKLSLHCKPRPCKAYREVISHRKKQVFITGNPVLIAGILFSLQGFPCKPLYFPVLDCSVHVEWSAFTEFSIPLEPRHHTATWCSRSNVVHTQVVATRVSTVHIFSI